MATYSPYSGEHGAKESSPFMNGNGSSAAPRKRSKWLRIGLPVAILVAVILAAVLGGVLGSRAAKNKNGDSSDPKPGSAEASSLASEKLSMGRFATSTDSKFMVPVYPSTVRSFSLA